MIDPKKFDDFINRAVSFTFIATMWFVMILTSFAIFSGGACD